MDFSLILVIHIFDEMVDNRYTTFTKRLRQAILENFLDLV